MHRVGVVEYVIVRERTDENAIFTKLFNRFVALSPLSFKWLQQLSTKSSFSVKSHIFYSANRSAGNVKSVCVIVESCNLFMMHFSNQVLTL